MKTSLFIIILLSVLLGALLAEDYLKEFNNLKPNRSAWIVGRSYGNLKRALNKGDNSHLLKILKANLNSDNKELRFYSARLLSEYYQQHPSPDFDWPPKKVMSIFVECLRHDNIKYNAWVSLDHLLTFKHPELVNTLYDEFQKNQPQSRLLSAYLLTKQTTKKYGRALTEYFVSQLVDDNISRNALISFNALLQLGSSNLEYYLEKDPSVDWLQAAYLSLLALKFNINWSPDRKFIHIWKEKSKSNKRRVLARIGLYLHPDTLKVFKLSEFNSKLFELDGSMKDPEEKYKWLLTWRPYLKNKYPGLKLYTILNSHTFAE